MAEMARFAAERRLLLIVAAVAAGLVGIAAAILVARGGGGGAVVAGVVVDESGAPVAGATITAAGARATSDESGNFRLGIRAGWITVSARGFLPRTRAAGPADRVVVRLARNAAGTVTFAFGGDVMFGRRYFDADEDGVPGGLLSLDAGVAEHLSLLEGVRPALEDADLAVVNLETPLAEEAFVDATGPRPAAYHPTKDFVFASRPPAARALERAGVDVVGIANNHLYDRLAPGVASTRAALEAAGFRPGEGFFGAGAREDEAWAPALRTVHGQRVGFVGCTSITGDEHAITYVAGPAKGGAARCEPSRLRREVSALAARADIVIAMIHGGYEYGREPSAQVRSLSDAAVAAGATMVIDHHPHVVGGLRFEGGKLTAWTLGNLLFDQTVQPTFESYLLRVAARRGKVVSAWIEPLRIEGFKPTAVLGADAAWVARGALARSDGPWVVDDGSLWLDTAGRARTGGGAAGAGLSEIRAGCSRSAGRDLLWTGDFEARSLTGTAGALWNIEPRNRDRRVIAGAAFSGRLGVRLRRSGADREDLLLSPAHRVLVRPGQDLTLLLRHRAVTGRPDARVVLAWYNDTRGGSQEQSVARLPRGRGWHSDRIDVDVPRNAVAVQPFVRLSPPSLSLVELDVDEVRLVDWAEPGCGYVRDAAPLVDRALAPLRPAAAATPVQATALRVRRPPALPPGPLDPGG